MEAQSGSRSRFDSPGPIQTLHADAEHRRKKDIGPSFAKSGGDWTATQQQSFNVQIPKCIAAGDYLLRIQQLGIHNPGGDPQFYVSCAQLKVTGGGSSSPPASALVSIPGAFSKSDPGYKVNIYNNFKSYTIPGPAVWGCGA